MENLKNKILFNENDGFVLLAGLALDLRQAWDRTAYEL